MHPFLPPTGFPPSNLGRNAQFGRRTPVPGRNAGWGEEGGRRGLQRARRRGLAVTAAALLSLLAAPASALTPAGGGSRPLTGRVVYLDAGHDGGNAAQPARARALVPAGGFRKPCNTTGTSTDSGYAEHAFTFDVVTRAAALLRAQGATVVLSRTSDTGFGPCVDRRAAIGNVAHADAAISVHADGALASGRGFHVIAPARAPDGGNTAMLTRSYRLALAVRAAFHTVTGEPYATYTARQGLTRRSDLAGLNLSRVPTVFVECGNMRNPGDARRMRDPAWRQSAARALVSSLG